MARDNDIRATQERIFRIALRGELTLKAISLDSGIPYNTLRSYAGHNGETAEMPVSALRKLIGVIPDELLSLLLPDGRSIVQVPENIDHNEIADAMVGYLARKQEAHRPDSECGPAIGPTEHRDLTCKLIVVTGGKAAA